MAEHEYEHDPTVASLVAELTELRAALAEQQAAIAALQLRQPKHPVPTAPRADTAPVASAASATEATEATGAASVEHAEHADDTTKRSTSRRGLLRGAAVAGAAAAVAAVAVGGAESAHAAPLATSGNFILGQPNDADATTILVPTSASNPNPLFKADNSSVAGTSPAIQAVSQSEFGAVKALGTSGGTGLYVSSDSGLAININGSGRILQTATTSGGAPPNGDYLGGEQIRDGNGEMWLCVASGNPGTWVRVAHVAPGLTGGAITFLASPLRLIDTRGGASNPAFYGYPSDPSHSPLFPVDHYYQVNGVSYNGETIPDNATGILGNVQTVNAVGAGFLAICPADVGFSGASNLVFEPGQVIANAFSGGIGLRITGTPPFVTFTTGIDIVTDGNAVDVIVDIFAVIL